jgi:hypothetical protein
MAGRDSGSNPATFRKKFAPQTKRSNKTANYGVMQKNLVAEAE